MGMKTDQQWCEDNGVPSDAKYSYLHEGRDAIALANGMLKKHGLRIRTKHRPGHGSGSYVWVEKVKEE